MLVPLVTPPGLLDLARPTGGGSEGFAPLLAGLLATAAPVVTSGKPAPVIGQPLPAGSGATAPIAVEAPPAGALPVSPVTGAPALVASAADAVADPIDPPPSGDLAAIVAHPAMVVPPPNSPPLRFVTRQAALPVVPLVPPPESTPAARARRDGSAAQADGADLPDEAPPVGAVSALPLLVLPIPAVAVAAPPPVIACVPGLSAHVTPDARAVSPPAAPPLLAGSASAPIVTPPIIASGGVGSPAVVAVPPVAARQGQAPSPSRRSDDVVREDGAASAAAPSRVSITGAGLAVPPSGEAGATPVRDATFPAVSDIAVIPAIAVARIARAPFTPVAAASAPASLTLDKVDPPTSVAAPSPPELPAPPAGPPPPAGRIAAASPPPLEANRPAPAANAALLVTADAPITIAGALPASVSPTPAVAPVVAVPGEPVSPLVTPRAEERPLATAAPVAPALARVALAPTILPALQAFGAAIRQALADERKPVRAATDPTVPAAAASPVASVSIPVAGQIDATLDTADRRWPHAMAQQIERLRDQADETSTRIRLIPDALGPVDVAVRRDGDTVHVHFTATSAETRQLLADAQPRLAEAADARGVKLGRTDVSGGDGAPGDDRQPGQRQPASQPLRPAPARAIAPADDADPGPDTRLA